MAVDISDVPAMSPVSGPQARLRTPRPGHGDARLFAGAQQAASARHQMIQAEPSETPANLPAAEPDLNAVIGAEPPGAILPMPMNEYGQRGRDSDSSASRDMPADGQSGFPAALPSNFFVPALTSGHSLLASAGDRAETRGKTPADAETFAHGPAQSEQMRVASGEHPIARDGMRAGGIAMPKAALLSKNALPQPPAVASGSAAVSAPVFFMPQSGHPLNGISPVAMTVVLDAPSGVTARLADDVRVAASPRVLMLQLEPEALGRLQVRLEVGADGMACSITAERAEGLEALLADDARLARAVGELSGLATGGLTVNGKLIDAAASPAPQTTTSSPGQSGSNVFAGWEAGGAHQSGGQGTSHQWPSAAGRLEAGVDNEKPAGRAGPEHEAVQRRAWGTDTPVTI
jgi:flagellar hook-length control protein FliK